MADTLNNKPKLQLVAGFSKNRPASPATPTKLLLNHGKPNFTIQRSPKMDEPRKFAANNVNNTINNKDDVILTNTKFFGVLNNVNNMPKEKRSEASTPTETETPKVILRRTPTIPPLKRSEEDTNVPEFILRQRAIQQRLAKDNVLDFDKRRSGYFTHVLISPTSPTPTIFAETMSSPAINPALEIPVPQTAAQNQVKEEQSKLETQIETLEQAITQNIENDHMENHNIVENTTKEIQLDDEEVANAIEEVNKAIAGEDIEQHANNADESHNDELKHVVPTTSEIDNHVSNVEVLDLQEPKLNGHAIDENNNADEEITISHTNGHDGPHIPSPDPSGVLGVNFEPKTVVSFSKDLGADENKYPDTVLVMTTQNNETEMDPELKELSKMKFDIKTDEQDIQVLPIVKTE